MIQRLGRASAANCLLFLAFLGCDPNQGTNGGTSSQEDGGDDDDDDDDDDSGIDASLIDDMEDGNAQLNDCCSIDGQWWTRTADEGTGAVSAANSVLSPPRNGSKRGIHITMSGLEDLGAAAGFDFREGGGEVNPWESLYLISRDHQGIRFWARDASYGGAGSTVRLNMPDAQTDVFVGNCDDADSDGDFDECFDHFGTEIVLDSNWTEFEFKFDDLKQEGWGTQFDRLDRQHVIGIEFVLKAGQSYDFWLDDVRFF